MSKPDLPSKPAVPATAPAVDKPVPIPAPAPADAGPASGKQPARPDETGGPAWPEPTRYGDWERAGRVSDF